MEDENKTAEETEETSAVGGNADTNQDPEQVNDAEFTDSTGEGEAQPKPQETPKPQTSEQNSENARRRREAEKQAAINAAREEARNQAIIETLGGKNPYTNEEMKDRADVEEYLAMKEIEKNGGDPLADFSKFQKQKEREKAAQAEKKAQEEDWYKKDYEDFVTKHPEANVQALIQNEQSKHKLFGGIRQTSDGMRVFAYLLRILALCSQERNPTAETDSREVYRATVQHSGDVRNQDANGYKVCAERV